MATDEELNEQAAGPEVTTESPDVKEIEPEIRANPDAPAPLDEHVEPEPVDPPEGVVAAASVETTCPEEAGAEVEPDAAAEPPAPAAPLPFVEQIADTNDSKLAHGPSTDKVITAGPPIPPGEHLVDIGSSGDPDKTVRRLSRRGFLWAGAYIVGVVGGWEWFIRRPESDNVLSPLRAMLRVNERIWRGYQSPKRLSPTFPQAFVAEPVQTGDVGLDDDSELDNWSLTVQHDADVTHTLTLAAIKALPRVDVIAEHKCIEGWSRVVHWTGARFSDFAAKYGPAALPDFVSMVTPDGQYYVGVEREAMLQPQVLLCYELNGKPLTSDHGAPLRLVMPNKYGIKSLKRIGSIEFTNHKPADYWAEQGYDWYAGL